jgi:hypothetical protein
MKRAILVLAVLAAGCGGGGDSGPSKADFKQQFAPVDAQLKATGQEMATVFTTAGKRTDAQLVKEIDSVGTHLGVVTAKLGRLTPPDELSGDYGALRKVLDGIAADISNLSSAVSAHDAQRSKAGAQKIVADSLRVKTTANRVRRAVGLKPTP